MLSLVVLVRLMVANIAEEIHTRVHVNSVDGCKELHICNKLVLPLKVEHNIAFPVNRCINKCNVINIMSNLQYCANKKNIHISKNFFKKCKRRNEKESSHFDSNTLLAKKVCIKASSYHAYMYVRIHIPKQLIFNSIPNHAS